MPNPLNNVLVPDQYDDKSCAILNIYGGRGGTFDVRDHPVFYQLQYGSLGAPYFTEETALQPGSGAIEPGAIGVRFRNQTAGQAATVDARIAPPGQPLLTLNSAGTTAATMITGRVSAAGAITAGTGFTIVKGAAGLYTVSFTTAFAATPIILLTPSFGAPAAVGLQYTAEGPTGFTVQVFLTPTGVLTDEPFNFLATSVL